jgi:hypothetical protein
MHETITLTLPRESCEIYTLVPIRDAEGGVAPIGLADMFNAAGAIISKALRADDVYEVELRAAGRFLAWSKRTPVRMDCAGQEIAFRFDPQTRALECVVPSTPARVRIYFT